MEKKRILKKNLCFGSRLHNTIAGTYDKARYLQGNCQIELTKQVFTFGHVL